VFIAELGDKSQLLALAFATRFRWWVVLGAMFIATAVIQLVAVGAGQLVGTVIPDQIIQLAAGLAFLGFGIWTLRGGEEEEEDPDHVAKARQFGPFVMVGLTFLVAEIGDKTMLTAGALASDLQQFWPVWIGATLGMFLADALAVAIGLVAGKRLPIDLIRIFAGIVFLGFGFFTLGRLAWTTFVGG
jgi:putative Ca2+/H+ antiporter (TMEM165/GDT1 family)